MSKSARTRAEQQFAPGQSKSKEAQKLKAEARQKRADKMARLRTLRLAKEEADRQDAAEKAAAEKAAKAATKPKRRARASAAG